MLLCGVSQSYVIWTFMRDIFVILGWFNFCDFWVMIWWITPILIDWHNTIRNGPFVRCWRPVRSFALLYVWDEQKLSKSIIQDLKFWKKFFLKSINLDLKSKILPEIQLKPINFFHNYNRGINGLLGHKAQHFLCPKKKSGILTAILKKFIGFNFWVFV